MSFAPTPLMALAFGVQAAGSIAQGQAQKQAADYNAAVARQNALIAQQQSVAATQAHERDTARRIGSMVASYGASGVQSDSGSPLDVLADSAAMATLDRLTLQYNYALKAAGYVNQSGLSDMEGKAASTAGMLNAAGSGMRAYGTYMQYPSAASSGQQSFGSRLDAFYGGTGTTGD